MNELIALSIPDLLRVFFLTVIAFFITTAFTPFLTYFLYRYKVWPKAKQTALTGEQAVELRKQQPASRLTPTMAGVLLWLTIALLTATFNLSRSQTWLPLGTLVAFGVFGLVDDLIGLRNGLSGIRGIKFSWKLFWTVLFAAVGAWWFYYKLDFSIIHIPGGNLFGLPYNIDIGAWYIPLFMLVVFSTAHGVNITDGLDGLAGGLLTLAFGAYAVIALTLGKGDLAAFAGTVAGVSLSYTWFNIPPARFFMGDTGALSLGATLGVLAMLTNTALVLPVIGAVFLIEGLSSNIQVLSKKFFGKKVFKIAPLHHHLVAIGWPETKVVMRLWVIGAVFAVIGLFAALLGKG